MLTLNPSRYLPFEGPQNQDMISSVKLTNQTTTNVAFKIKTNVPKLMLGVSPKRGVIEPNQEQIVQVKLSSKLFDFGKPSAPYAIQVQSTDFYQFVDEISNVWNKGRKINLQSLTICYVDRNVGHQNHGATVVPVTNFAPIPANVHVFGGKAIVQDEPQQTNWDDVPKPAIQPGAWGQEQQQATVDPQNNVADEDWDTNTNQVQANSEGNQQPAAAVQNDNWDNLQVAQVDEWGQNAKWDNQDQNNENWDNQQQNYDAGEYHDIGNQAPAYGNNQDWAAPAHNNFFEAEILATTFRMWRESIVYAIGFFILGILLGKAGL